MSCTTPGGSACGTVVNWCNWRELPHGTRDRDANGSQLAAWVARSSALVAHDSRPATRTAQSLHGERRVALGMLNIV